MIPRFGIMKTLACSTLSIGFAALLLSGCAADQGRYPSLATRDAERVGGQFTPSAPVQEAPAYSTDPASIDAALEQARGFHARFEADRPAAMTLARAASGSGDESDARSRALVALAGLSTLHGQTVMALGDLDTIEAASAVEFGSLDDIRAAQTAIAQMVEQQNAVLDSIAQEMSR